MTPTAEGPAVNGPTEREQRWAETCTGQPVSWHAMTPYMRDVLSRAMAEADRESAALRARVAVLEQQIAAVREESASAIEALARDGLTSPNGAQIQFDGSAVWALNAAAGAVRALAAGVVDNPTEPGCPRCAHPRLAHWTPGNSSTACGVCLDRQIRTADLRTGAVGFCCIPAVDIARPTEGSPS